MDRLHFSCQRIGRVFTFTLPGTNEKGTIAERKQPVSRSDIFAQSLFYLLLVSSGALQTNLKQRDR